MDISHEVPISLLEKSLEFNDYDYALVHLFENEEYLNFYRKSLKMGRRVILDNSLFELGEAFSIEKFYEGIMKLVSNLGTDFAPNLEYIIPDVWMNCDATIDSVNEWIAGGYKEKLSHFKSIGVIQGDSNANLTKCLTDIKDKVDRVAISFGYKHWKENEVAAKNRSIFIHNNYEMLKDLDVHLLGCWSPYEFSEYKTNKYSFIKTLDTSSPVLHGIHEDRYFWFGVLQKNTDKIDNHMTKDVAYTDLMDHNVKAFRQIATGVNVALSGVQSSGKTTILNAFEDETWNKYSNTMLKISKTHSINEDGDNATQKIVMDTHENLIYKSLVQTKPTIFDRSILDGFVYTIHMLKMGKINRETFEHAKNKFMLNIHFYDVIFYLMPELGICDDGTRSTNVEFYNSIVDIFEEVISATEIRVVRLSGSVEERMEIINNELSKYSGSLK